MPENSEILEAVHACVKEVLDREAAGLAQQIKYTDNDVVAVTLLYQHVLGNRVVHMLREEKVGITMAETYGKHCTSLINEVTLCMSGIDMRTYYKKGEKK